MRALRQVSGVLLAHGDARSSETTDRESPKARQHDTRRVPGRIGWWVMRPDGREWWVTAPQWREVVCHGIDPEATAQLLAEMDLLIRPTARRELQHATYIRGHGPARVYKLRPEVTLAGG